MNVYKYALENFYMVVYWIPLYKEGNEKKKALPMVCRYGKRGILIKWIVIQPLKWVNEISPYQYGYKYLKIDEIILLCNNNSCKLKDKYFKIFHIIRYISNKIWKGRDGNGTRKVLEGASIFFLLIQKIWV